MIGEIGIGVVLDGVILIMLVVTVIYAVRLSSLLNSFRDNRAFIETLIAELSLSVEKAEQAIQGLRSSARESGRDLQSLINEASALSDELQIMTEAGDNMALRLEKVAQKNANIINKPSTSSLKERESSSGFSIVDHEFSRDEDASVEDEDNNYPSFLRSDEDSYDDFQSRAERELFEALSSKSGIKTDAGEV
jgi:hypothetical protein